jgi:hypothetical protein
MDEDQYQLLKGFPTNKRYLSHKELADFNGNPEYTMLTSLYDPLWEKRLIEGRIPKPGLRITDKGINAIMLHEKTVNRNAEIEGIQDELTRRSLQKTNLEIDDLYSRINDYPNIRRKANQSHVISWITLILLLLTTAQQLMCNKRDSPSSLNRPSSRNEKAFIVTSKQ